MKETITLIELILAMLVPISVIFGFFLAIKIDIATLKVKVNNIIDDIKEIKEKISQ